MSKPALKVVERATAASQIDAIATSIQRFGWTNPILVDGDGTVIAGHARLAAARQLGHERVPTIELKDLTPEQVRAYVIADNRLAELAGWDEEVLASELAALEAAGFDLEVVGFSERELFDLGIFGPEGAPEEQPPPAPMDAATSRRGDVWILGPHRLMNGDSGSVADLDQLLAGEPIHLVHMDPPYNVNVEPRSNNAISAGLSSFEGTKHHQALDLARHPAKSKPTTRKMRAKDRPLANDCISAGDFERVLRDWISNAARVLLPGHAFYIWGGYANLANYPPAISEAGLYFAQGIVWNKLHPVLTRKDFMGAYDLAYYGWKEGAGHRFFGPNNAPDLWEVKKVPSSQMVHLTEKPVELAARAMQYSSLPGENVLDLFGGSGSTLIAAHQNGRRGFLIELDGPYTDVIVERWQRLTGEEARLEADGRTFAAVKLERAP